MITKENQIDRILEKIKKICIADQTIRISQIISICTPLGWDTFHTTNDELERKLNCLLEMYGWNNETSE